jgi:hypothetical protein
MLAGSRIRAVLRGSFRLLTFRSTREELLSLDRSHLVFGLLATWCVGIEAYWFNPQSGRYWFDPQAPWWRWTGLSSLAYVGALSLGWWLIFMPLKPEAWSLRRVLTFMSLLSVPGVVHIIPPLCFTHPWARLPAATLPAAWLLGAVVTWRAALALWFLVRVGRLPWLAALAAMLLPLNAIPIALSYFDVQHPIDELVNGMRSLDLFLIGCVLLLPLSLSAYVATLIWSYLARRAKRAAAPSAKSD